MKPEDLKLFAELDSTMALVTGRTRSVALRHTPVFCLYGEGGVSKSCAVLSDLCCGWRSGAR